jgi:hypothetical protein
VQQQRRLFGAQRDHRIDPARATCRQAARRRGGAEQHSNSGAPPLARPARPGRRQHVEPDLMKVTIGGDHRRQPKLAHDRDARAVRERQVLIAVLEEQVSRSFEPIVIDPLPPQPGASVDLAPPRIRGSETQAKSDQRKRKNPQCLTERRTSVRLISPSEARSRARCVLLAAPAQTPRPAQSQGTAARRLQTWLDRGPTARTAADRDSG